MKISGKKVADTIKGELKLRINKLREKGITPKIAIITLGPEKSWEFYVRQKVKVAQELGIEAMLIPMAEAEEQTLLDKIGEINGDSGFHGVIVQRPMPDRIDKQLVTSAIAPEKDIDGFREDSMFEVPVWLAAKRLTEESLKELGIRSEWNKLNFVVIGKGETAGGPVIKGLKNLGAEAAIIDSKTENPSEIIKKADIVITCAGKQGIVNSGNIKKGAMLIGVGTRGEDGKLRGDYEESDIENIAGSYTPTPGGVGPVNLSYLFMNLIVATESQIKS